MSAVASPALQTSRVVAGAVLLTGLVGVVVLAAIWIPWHPYPGSTPPTPPASAWFSPDQLARARSYSRLARWLSRSELLVSVLMACLLALAGRRVTRWLRGCWWLRVVEAALLCTVVGRVVTLSFAIALQHHARTFGLSVERWGGWALDQLIGAGLTVLVTAVALVALLGCVRRFPRTWPAVAGGLAAALVVLGSLAYPVTVEPLFTHVASLPPGELRTQILALAEQEHLHVSDVLVADASRRTTAENAYVDGFGPSRRVVLYDTLLDGLPRDEVLSVVAHELGHARHDDVLHGTLIGAAGALAALGLLGLLLGRRYDGLRDPRAVPALLALWAVAGVLVLPVENEMSRRIETRADVAALTTTRDQAAFDDLQVRLALSALQDPTPPGWSQWWFGDHPTSLERIAVAGRVLGGK